ncbi:MAG: universal stress protein [Liquorilactobacillus hordei]|uniref:universal stress protein n=1 Tax=Liquorilactobacillus hordei TaxID=468911 RepID=UPI0039EA0591
MAVNEKNLQFEIEDKPFSRVLVAVDQDDSSSSIKAFQFAVTLASRNKAKLGIVSILELEDLNVFEALSPEKRNEISSTLLADVNVYVKIAKEHGVKEVEGFVAEGKPAPTIISDIIPTFKPDVLVCGSKTKHVSKREKIFIGSQASYLAQNSPCSVLVIRK